MDNKTIALAKFLEVSADTILNNGDNCFQKKGGGEFLVLTDTEANETAQAYIVDSLWTFNVEFILDTCELNNTPEIASTLRVMLSSACEGANEFVKTLVEGTCGLGQFTQAAIDSDGRGPFVSLYDGEENECDGLYIYRIY